MTDSTLWWIFVGCAVAVEMLTGTFYLLMLAVGMVAGAIAAHLGLSLSLQLVSAAVVGGGAVAAWYFIRGKRSEDPNPNPGANRDINLDVGEAVHVDSWNADGTASIKYRGANWTAIPTPGTVPGTGAHRVRELVGNRLVVEKV